VARPDAWLTRLDRAARSLPRSRTWSDLLAFILVRHPHLRPTQSYYESFDGLIDDWVRTLDGLGILRDSADQQQQRELAALVLDSLEWVESWKVEKPSLQRMKRMADAGPGKVRKVTRKIDRAKALLVSSLEDLAETDLFTEEEVRRALHDGLDALARAKFPPGDESVTSYTTRMAGLYDQSMRNSSEAGDPKPDIADLLVSYLQCACQFSAVKSRLATMQIGNKVFDWDYHATPNAYGVQDCDAIRMMVARHRRTLSKKRS